MIRPSRFLTASFSGTAGTIASIPSWQGHFMKARPVVHGYAGVFGNSFRLPERAGELVIREVSAVCQVMGDAAAVASPGVEPMFWELYSFPKDVVLPAPVDIGTKGGRLLASGAYTGTQAQRVDIDSGQDLVVRAIFMPRSGSADIVTHTGAVDVLIERHGAGEGKPSEVHG